MSDEICKYWYEDGEPLQEICKASGRRCICSAQLKYCEWRKAREEKEKQEQCRHFKETPGGIVGAVNPYSGVCQECGKIVQQKGE